MNTLRTGALLFCLVGPGPTSAEPLGLPPVPIPADNPQSERKTTLGNTFLPRPAFQ